MSTLTLEMLRETIRNFEAAIPKTPPLNPRIFESTALGKDTQFRKPRSKRKRIQKKWAKNKRNWRFVPDLNNVYMTEAGIFCHPILARQLRMQLKESELFRFVT